MNAKLDAIFAFMVDIERLKTVYRKAYVSDLSRHENSAEHTWHLAIGLLTIAEELKVQFDLHKALKMALVHDICEIDGGDISVFDPRRGSNTEAEAAGMERIAQHNVAFAKEARDLWFEYEAQQSVESRWVKIMDRLLPFMINLSTGGKTWQDQKVVRSQVIKINEPIRIHAPEIYAWMMIRLDECVAKGWLIDG